VAGGEQTVTLRHDDSLLVLKNVLVGEVWLCSGQSNMEMPLEGWPPNDTVSNAAWEIEHAVYPHIRLFSMQRSYSATPETECAGSWTACSPATVRLFSATAYFFGRKLHESLNVPVGLIAASWGGSPVEAWMSRESAGAFKEFAATLQAIDVCKESLLVQNRWLAARPAVVVTGPDPLHRWEGLRFEDDSCSSLNAADEAWPTMTLPRLWEGTGLGAFDGAVWFRTRVALPAAWRGRALSLHLGPIDDMDETYVNGAQVGSTMQEGYWKLERIYTVPDSLTRDSVAVIAVRVVDTQGGGGMWGDSASLALTCPGMDSTVSLAGSWKYLPVAEYRAGVFRVFGGPANGFEHGPRFELVFLGL
jgi:sialate O-acetylesterase